MEVGRQRGIEKFVSIGTVCAYPKVTPVPFKGADLWDRIPEETNAPYRFAKRMLLVQGKRTVSSTAFARSTCNP